MEADWDLNAVVRSFTTVISSSSSAAAGTTTTTGDKKTDPPPPVPLPPPSVAVPPPPLEHKLFGDSSGNRKENGGGGFNLGYINDPFAAKNQDLQELFHSFCPSIKNLNPQIMNNDSTTSITTGPGSAGLIGGGLTLSQQQPRMKQFQPSPPPPPHQVFFQQQQRTQAARIQQFSRQQRTQAAGIQQFSQQQRMNQQQQSQAQQQQQQRMNQQQQSQAQQQPQQFIQQFPTAGHQRFQQHPSQLKQSQFIFGTNNSANGGTNTIPASAAAPVVTVTSQNKMETTTVPASTITPVTHRNKKRKNLIKKVCHVRAEALTTDVWAWRKYGQKPIKGSPYPRGYYRCSSSKGCPARKQVERNRSDPNMFILTFTAEHNHPIPTHRNSLAGSTRLKPITLVNQQTAMVTNTPETESTGATTTPTTSSSSTTTPTNQQQLSCSSPATNNGNLSPKIENDCEPFPKAENNNKPSLKTENDGGDESKHIEEILLADNGITLADEVLSEDFFKGLEDLEDDAEVDFLTDNSNSPVEMEIPWLFSNDHISSNSMNNNKNTAGPRRS